MSAVKESINEYARSLGFEAVGFVRAQRMPEAEQGLAKFLSHGHHGTMKWMEPRSEQRANPAALWPEAKSIIVVGHNYGPESNPLDKLNQKSSGNISCYAGGDDYHGVIKKKLKQLARWIADAHSADVKVFVDTAPVMEKPIAASTGIGWQGKHTCLVSREYGSWLFLGEVFTTLEIEPDEPEQNHCGSCRSCLDICPTNAFTQAGNIDARKCISYLTIEHKEHIEEQFRRHMGNRIYGCDDCLAVCPWNKFAKVAQEFKYHTRDVLRNPALSELLILEDATFRALFAKSPVKRIGRDRFIRNVLIAAGNSEDKNLIPLIESLLDDASAIVRAMAVWAIRMLDPLVFSKHRTILYTNESDPNVLKEWNHG